MSKLILLGAGSISTRVPFLSQAARDPLFVPLGVYSAFKHNTLFFREYVDTVIIICNIGAADRIRKEAYCIPGIDKIQLKISECYTADIIESLRFALKHVNEGDDCIITPSTTISCKFPSLFSICLDDRIRHPNGWSTVEINDRDVTFCSRNEPVRRAGNAFTGVIRGQAHHLSKALQSTDTNDLVDVAHYLYSTFDYSFEYVPWVDIGHSANYFQAKALVVSSRHFNHICIDLPKGLLVKSSTNFEKIKSEYDYINNLPNELKFWFPRLTKLTEPFESSRGSVTMEYYAYPTCAEMFLYWDLHDTQWSMLFETLDIVLRSFRNFPTDISPEQFHGFYFEKLVVRLSALSEQNDIFRMLMASPLCCNGLTIQPIDRQLDYISKRVLNMYTQTDNVIMHGDLCFNNILCDPNGGTVRLIDPRGKFYSDLPAVCGDIKYDLAKIAHSAIYGYDFIVSGMYRLEMNHEDKIYEYEIYYNENQAKTQKCSIELIKGLGYDVDDIEFLCALLFLSMVPLHAENFNKQAVMWLHGLTILHRSRIKYENMR